MDLFETVLKTGSALAVALALVVLAALGARRWLAPALASASARRSVRLVGSFALGGRRDVLVLDVQGRTIVVGATPQQLTLLMAFESPTVSPPLLSEGADQGEGA